MSRPEARPGDPAARARVEAHTIELCAIPSVTGEEGPCADHVEAVLRRTSLEVERIGASVVARGPRTDRPLVLLVGHTDTVPGAVELRRDGDRIHGRGASDMKGGLALMLALAEARDPAEGPYDVGYVFYDREEGPWIHSGLGPVLDGVGWLHQASLAFCLEPSDNEVQVGCMGTLHAKVTLAGVAAHSARPWQGDNAIHAAGPLLVALGARAPRDVDCGGFLFREVLSATIARGGGARNVIPDRFELNLNFRFAPGRSVEDAGDELVAFVAAYAPRASVELVERAPSGRVVTDNPLLRRFVSLNQSVVTAKQAWTDVARLSQVGVDAVNLGPGLTAQAHKADEYIEVGHLRAAWDQMARFLGP